MILPTIEQLGDLSSKVVLVRCDFNVPLNIDQNSELKVSIADDFRIRQAIPTLKKLLEQGAEVKVCTHLGRPKGKPDPRYSVEPVREFLNELLPGVHLMENLRFDPGEEKNDDNFVRHLIEGVDFYVNDAFGVCHREHASIVGPPKYLPSAAGLLVLKEVNKICSLFESPKRPFVAIVGGAKVSDKLGLLSSLARDADYVLVGGAMAMTLLKAKGLNVGSSLVEDHLLTEAQNLLKTYPNILLPVDFVVIKADPLNEVNTQLDPENIDEQIIVTEKIQDNWSCHDIGPKTAGIYEQYILKAQTIFWNGPMGVFEDPRFAEGTRQIALAISKSDGYSLIGGGDSASALRHMHLENAVSYISTGGGACLELIEFRDLPGLKALRESFKK